MPPMWGSSTFFVSVTDRVEPLLRSKGARFDDALG
jgi:hypothetical protein